MSYGDDYEDAHARRTPAQTRTRLPDQPEPTTRRTSPSPGRNTVTIVGVIVLLVAAIVFANQARDDSGGQSSDNDQGSQAQPTSPTGELPVEGATNGIPSGFPQTEQGAESAAANYAVALGGTGMFNPTEREAIVSTIYAPAVGATTLTEFHSAYSDAAFLQRIGLTEAGLPPDGMTFVSRVNPVGSRIVSFDQNSAQVAVWYSALFGLAGDASENPVTESWYTTTYQLAWENEDWKILSFEQIEGPVPVGQDQRASSAEEMADAIEQFGGFTYAR